MQLLTINILLCCTITTIAGSFSGRMYTFEVTRVFIQGNKSSGKLKGRTESVRRVRSTCELGGY